MMDASSLPLWCDLVILPEIPMDSHENSSDQQHRLAPFAKYLEQQEFNSCGQDNAIFLSDMPLFSKSGGYLMSLSSCQTQVTLNSEEIILPVQAMPSTFSLFLESGSRIGSDHLVHSALHPNESGGVTELEVTFDFSAAESIMRDILTPVVENITLDGEWNDDQCSEEPVFVDFAISDKHEQLLMVLKTLAEREAQEFTQTLTGLAVVAITLIGGYVWLSFSILQKKRCPRAAKKRKANAGVLEMPSPTSGIFRSGTVESGRRDQDAAVESDCTDVTSSISSEDFPIDKATLIQRFVRMKIACDEVTRKLALVIQLQSVYRGYHVRRQFAPVHSITFDHSQEVSIDGSSEDEAFVPEPVPTPGSNEQPIIDPELMDVYSCLSIGLGPVPRIERITTLKHSFASCVHQIPKDFALELQAKLRIRRMKAGVQKSFDAEVKDSTNHKYAGYQPSPLSEQPFPSSSPQPRCHVDFSSNANVLSPMSKITEQWKASKNSRRKNRRPSSTTLIATASHSYGHELPQRRFDPTSVNDNIASVESNACFSVRMDECSKERSKHPLLSPVIAESSPGGSLLCPTSGSEADADESFLQDYW
jgi:hypothetical protein